VLVEWHGRFSAVAVTPSPPLYAVTLGSVMCNFRISAVAVTPSPPLHAVTLGSVLCNIRISAVEMVERLY
jgi:hypothetical protein